MLHVFYDLTLSPQRKDHAMSWIALIVIIYVYLSVTLIMCVCALRDLSCWTDQLHNAQVGAHSLPNTTPSPPSLFHTTSSPLLPLSFPSLIPPSLCHTSLTSLSLLLPRSLPSLPLPSPSLSPLPPSLSQSHWDMQS